MKVTTTLFACVSLAALSSAAQEDDWIIRADTVYTVEELMAMILSHARDIGVSFTEQKIKDVVITVPAYFSQAERRALLQSAGKKISFLDFSEEMKY